MSTWLVWSMCCHLEDLVSVFSSILQTLNSEHSFLADCHLGSTQLSQLLDTESFPPATPDPWHHSEPAPATTSDSPCYSPTPGPGSMIWDTCSRTSWQRSPGCWWTCRRSPSMIQSCLLLHSWNSRLLRFQIQLLLMLSCSRMCWSCWGGGECRHQRDEQRCQSLESHWRRCREIWAFRD